MPLPHAAIVRSTSRGDSVDQSLLARTFKGDPVKEGKFIRNSVLRTSNSSILVISQMEGKQKVYGLVAGIKTN